MLRSGASLSKRFLIVFLVIDRLRLNDDAWVVGLVHKLAIHHTAVERFHDRVPVFTLVAVIDGRLTCQYDKLFLRLLAFAPLLFEGLGLTGGVGHEDLADDIEFALLVTAKQRRNLIDDVRVGHRSRVLHRVPLLVALVLLARCVIDDGRSSKPRRLLLEHAQLARRFSLRAVKLGRQAPRIARHGVVMPFAVLLVVLILSVVLHRRARVNSLMQPADSGLLRALIRAFGDCARFEDPNAFLPRQAISLFVTVDRRWRRWLGLLWLL